MDNNNAREQEWIKWSRMLREMVRLFVAAVTGTLILLALADDPYDGDELVKGPAVGIGAYGGDKALRRIMGEEEDK